jgi:outer membrane lipoprotein-sorting protein
MSGIKKFINYFIIAIFVLIPAGMLFSQLESTSVFDNVLKKYSGVKSVSFSFTSTEQPGLKGKIKAKLGNKYIITTGDRTITCNGKSIWNYTKKDNKVVLSSYEDAESDELSIEKVFFNFLQQYKAVSVARNTSSSGPPAYEIVLEPKNKPTKFSSMSLSRVIIKVDRKDYTLLSITISDNGALQTWSVKSIKLNQEIKDESFNFEVPEGASVVDLR